MIMIDLWNLWKRPASYVLRLFSYNLIIKSFVIKKRETVSPDGKVTKSFQNQLKIKLYSRPIWYLFCLYNKFDLVINF